MEKGEGCKCLYPFQISCTKQYVKYGEGMLGYCPIPLYPNSIYMIVLNVLHSPRRKLRMKLQPHLPVQCDCSPSPFFSSPLQLASAHFFTTFSIHYRIPYSALMYILILAMTPQLHAT